MVIDSILVSHFVDPDLRVEIFFEKEGAAENGGVDFEIGDIGTSALLYGGRRTFMQSLSALLFYCFSSDKKQLLKALLTCTKAVPVDLNMKFI